MLQPYEDHVPDYGDGDFELAEPECFICGRQWPCPLTIAYNDGINDGQVMAAQAGYNNP